MAKLCIAKREFNGEDLDLAINSVLVFFHFSFCRFSSASNENDEANNKNFHHHVPSEKRPFFHAFCYGEKNFLVFLLISANNFFLFQYRFPLG
jgi:hypothetical protein